MINIDYNHCTGCGACVQSCPIGCIKWEERDFGFMYPVVDSTSCVNCGACERICPISKEKKTNNIQVVYAAVNSNSNDVSNSTSGGVFTALANKTLEQNGIVYGCEMDEQFKVHHIRVNDKNALKALCGSKYVQSEIRDTFKLVKHDLQNGKQVLFSGTPCQVAGLKQFLGNENDRLLTIDLICHGVSSQKYFDKYLSMIEAKMGKPVSIKFRDKKFLGWSCGGTITYINKTTHSTVTKPLYNFDNFYYHYFLSGKTYRLSCYSCPYSNSNRVGDISLGDFWGSESLDLSFNVYNGCSLVIVNSIRGLDFFNSLDSLKSNEVSLEIAKKRNEQLNRPAKLPVERDELSKQYSTLSGSQIQKTYKSKYKLIILKGMIKKLVPYKLKLYLRSRGIKG